MSIFRKKTFNVMSLLIIAAFLFQQLSFAELYYKSSDKPSSGASNIATNSAFEVEGAVDNEEAIAKEAVGQFLKAIVDKIRKEHEGMLSPEDLAAALEKACQTWKDTYTRQRPALRFNLDALIEAEIADILPIAQAEGFEAGSIPEEILRVVELLRVSDLLPEQQRDEYGDRGDCGVFCHVGPSLNEGGLDPKPTMYVGAKEHEHRGYQSAGGAIIGVRSGKAFGERIAVLGGADDLKPVIDELPSEETGDAKVRMIHLRWPTTSPATPDNQHPIVITPAEDSGIHPVYTIFNGDVTNYDKIDSWLSQEASNRNDDALKRPIAIGTDAWTIGALVYYYYRYSTPHSSKNDFLRAIAMAYEKMEGYFAVVITSLDYPDTAFGFVKSDMPLYIGLGENREGARIGNFFASEAGGIVNWTRYSQKVKDGDIAALTEDSATISRMQAGNIELVSQITPNAITQAIAQKTVPHGASGYKVTELNPEEYAYAKEPDQRYYFAQEIYYQPYSLAATIFGYVPPSLYPGRLPVDLSEDEVRKSIEFRNRLYQIVIDERRLPTNKEIISLYRELTGQETLPEGLLETGIREDRVNGITRWVKNPKEAERSSVMPAGIRLSIDEIRGFKRILGAASGTSGHAIKAMQTAMENMTGTSADVYSGSEYVDMIDAQLRHIFAALKESGVPLSEFMSPEEIERHFPGELFKVKAEVEDLVVLIKALKKIEKDERYRNIPELATFRRLQQEASETLGIAVSQSGGTKDTLNIINIGQALGIKFISIINRPGVTDIGEKTENDGGLLQTYAKAEKGVASSKAHTAQEAMLYELSIWLGLVRGTLSPADARRRLDELVAIPGMIQGILEDLSPSREDNWAKRVAQAIKGEQAIIYFGRGGKERLYAVALEGALKLKELTYMLAEGQNLGEMKHGPISFFPATADQRLKGYCVVLLTDSSVFDKAFLNLREIVGREGTPICIVYAGSDEERRVREFLADRPEARGAILAIPRVSDDLAPILTIVPLQVLALETTLAINDVSETIGELSGELYWLLKDYRKYNDVSEIEQRKLDAGFTEVARHIDETWDDLLATGALNMMPAGKLKQLRIAISDILNAELPNDRIVRAERLIRLLTNKEVTRIAFFENAIEQYSTTLPEWDREQLRLAGEIMESVRSDVLQASKDMAIEPTVRERYLQVAFLRESYKRLEPIVSSLTQRHAVVARERAKGVEIEDSQLLGLYNNWFAQMGLSQFLARNPDTPRGLAKIVTVEDSLKKEIRDLLAGPLDLSESEVAELAKGVMWYEAAATGMPIDFNVSPLRTRLSFARLIAEVESDPQRGIVVKPGAIIRRGLIHERIHNMLRTLELPTLHRILGTMDVQIRQIDPDFKVKFEEEYREYSEETYGADSYRMYLEEVIAKYYLEKVRDNGQIPPLFGQIAPAIEAAMREVGLRRELVERLPEPMRNNPPANLHELFDINSSYTVHPRAGIEQPNLELLKLAQLTASAKAAGISPKLATKDDMDDVVEKARQRLIELREREVTTAAEAGFAKGQDRTEGSGIELEESVSYHRRLQFVNFTLDPNTPPKVEHALMMQVMREYPEDFNNMVNQMRKVLTERFSVSNAAQLAPPATISLFFRSILPVVREQLAPFAVKYELDPHATFVLEWGSRRPAHYYQRGKWEQKIILNINLFLDDNMVAAEGLHEILHPLVTSWLKYSHIEFPIVYALAGLQVKRGIAKPIPQEDFATVWDWDLARDDIALFREMIYRMTTSKDRGMRRRGGELVKFATLMAARNIRDLKASPVPRDQQAAHNIERGGDPDAHPLNLRRIDLATLEYLLRESIDALDTSPRLDMQTKARARRRIIFRQIEPTVEAMLSDEMLHKDPNLHIFASEMRETLDAKAVREALAEIFILKEELDLLDERGREHAIEVLRGNNILDKDGKFARLLELEGSDRIAAIIEHINDPGLYKSKPQLARGAEIIARVYAEYPEAVTDFVINALHKRLLEYEPLPIDTPADMNGVVDALNQQYDGKSIEELEVRFTDPEGKLKGQRKSVKMPVNESTRGLLREGIGFDGSSVPSSISVDGKRTMFAEIFGSDFVASFVPQSLMIYEEHISPGSPETRLVAKIDAEAKIPLENVPHEIGIEHQVRSKQIASEEIARLKQEPDIQKASEQAMDLLTSGKYPVSAIKLALSDWTEEMTMIPIESSDLPQVFGDGFVLPEDMAQYLPTLRGKKGFKVKADPYSLTFVRYRTPRGDRIEAVMQVEIIDPDGRPFEGDFRTKLKQTVIMAEQDEGLGYIPYMSPEPEVFFFRRIEDEQGKLTVRATADVGRYYDDVRRAPLDVQKVFDDIIVSAESAGITLRYVHNEVAPGQYEIPYEHGPALESADRTALYKHIVKAVAKQNGLEACFMPKPITGENGSGMHIHQSLMAVRDMEINGVQYKAGDNVFFLPNNPQNYYLSNVAESYIGGLLTYGGAILRLTNPDPNSFMRLRPGYEAPIALVMGTKNRSAAVRIPEFPVPADGSNAPAARIEYRVPDACGNIHAKFWAILEAGLEGVRQKIEPPARLGEGESVFRMSTQEKRERGIIELPGGPGGLQSAIALMNFPKFEPFITRLLGQPDSDLRLFLSQPQELYADVRQPTGAVRLAKAKDQSTALDADEHDKVAGVTAYLLEDPVKSNAHAIVVNGQDIGKVALDNGAAAGFAPVLAELEKRGVNPDANIIIIPGFEDACENVGVPGIVSQEGRGLLPKGVGRNIYIDANRYHELMDFGTLDEQVEFFTHLITHLDKPIQDGEAPDDYEARIEKEVPTENARARFDRVDEAIVKIRRPAGDILSADDKANVDALAALTTGQEAGKLQLAKIGLIIPARFIMENIGIRETLEKLEQSGAQFSVIVDAENESEQKIIERLNLPLVEVVTAAPEATRQERIDNIVRHLRSKGVPQAQIGLIENPTANVEAEIAQMQSITRDIYVGIPQAPSEGQLISVHGVIADVVEAIAKRREQRVFAITLPPIERPSGELQERFREYREAIEFLKAA